MYTVTNFKSKKALREAVAAGTEVRLFAPGLGTPKTEGVEFVEGPHGVHKWYAECTMKDGVVVSVK